MAINEDLAPNKGRYFQDIQAWPLSTSLNYQGWLGNFTTAAEKRLAYKLLNFFIYYNRIWIDKLLMYAIGNVGNFINTPTWDHSYFRHACYYSTIPGDPMLNDPSGSGVLFLRKLRNPQFNVIEDQIYNYNSLFDMLQQTRQPVVVIFVDDFVGSGDQCIDAFKYSNNKIGKSLNDIAAEGKHSLIFATTIINKTGYDKIIQECPNIKLSYAYLLDEKYNIFNHKCHCWDNQQSYEEGTELIINISKELKIPDTGVTNMKGYKEQGLAISFEHGTPDATIPLFYWNDNGWIPLIEKAYER